MCFFQLLERLGTNISSELRSNSRRCVADSCEDDRHCGNAFLLQEFTFQVSVLDFGWVGGREVLGWPVVWKPSSPPPHADLWCH